MNDTTKPNKKFCNNFIINITTSNWSNHIKTNKHKRRSNPNPIIINKE